MFFRAFDRYPQIAAFSIHAVLSSVRATDGLFDLLSCSIYSVSRNVVASHWPGPSYQALSDLRVRFHLNCCLPTFVSVLGLVPEPALRLERGQVHEWMIPKPIVSASIHCVVQDCFSHPSTHPATVGNLLSVSNHAKISRMVLDLLHVPVSFSRNRVHQRISC